jgi:hypothetical protein
MNEWKKEQTRKKQQQKESLRAIKKEGKGGKEGGRSSLRQSG